MDNINKLNNYLKTLEIDEIEEDKGKNKTLERDLLIKKPKFNPIRLNFDTNQNMNENTIDQQMSNYNFVKKTGALK